jgi:hypothetical protein
MRASNSSIPGGLLHRQLVFVYQATTIKPAAGAIASSKGTQLVCRLPLAALHSPTRNYLSWRPAAVVRYGISTTGGGHRHTGGFSGCRGKPPEGLVLDTSGACDGATLLSSIPFLHPACLCIGICPGVTGISSTGCQVSHRANEKPLQRSPDIKPLSDAHDAASCYLAAGVTGRTRGNPQ